MPHLDEYNLTKNDKNIHLYIPKILIRWYNFELTNDNDYHYRI